MTDTRFIRVSDGDFKCSCGAVGNYPHVCPKEEELCDPGDELNECTCCDECEGQCCQDI